MVGLYSRVTLVCGALIVFTAVAGLIGGWDDAVMQTLVVAIKPTNHLYDGFRIWISLAVFGMFLIWVGVYLSRHYRYASSLPAFQAPILWGASLAVTPIFLSAHHGWGWVPEFWFLEDGPFEYLTVAILIVVAGLALMGLSRSWSRLEKSERALLIIFAIGLLFLAGEEASWGQRIIGIETPEKLKASNHQGELNVHNLFLGWNEILRMVIACFLSAIVILLHRDAIPGLRGRLAILKPDDRFFWFPLILIPSHLYDEWFEQVVSFAIMSYGLLLYRRLARPVEVA